MKFESRRAIRSVVGLMVLCLLGTAGARGQGNMAASGDKPQMSEDAFKNIQVLRGIPVSEFMNTMGFFAAALSMNCTDCHTSDSAGNWAKYADDTQLKNTARRMVLMENLINRADFGNTRLVTCYTCHRGAQRPDTTPSLMEQYGTPPPDDPDDVLQLPNTPADTSAAAAQILDKYIQAIGGAAAAAKLTSFTAKGTYSGFDTDFQKAPADIYAKAPNMRALSNHLAGGDNTYTFDGHEAWQAGADRPVSLIMLTGGDLDGARVDGDLNFPTSLKQDLTKWRAGFPAVTIGTHSTQVIEGMAGDTRVKLYFDKTTGLLVRQTRFVNTAVGLIPQHVDYSDYRVVAGVKLPFKWQNTWTDGQSTTELASIQANAAVDASKFAKPAPAVPKEPAKK
ncbi:MAG TPA: photosynthetic reaction center cytochrome c subunit family protein [Verrucomicrobiae bacterium]|jgi:photosynthetic reaction center cytochrome c subunit|nr:photosynthetic reaction center cytochrome c subunit family protein [Verrucomicrobiae bacterium]